MYELYQMIQFERVYFSGFPRYIECNSKMQVSAQGKQNIQPNPLQNYGEAQVT